MLGEALHERDVLVRVRRIYVGPQTVQRLEDAVLAPPEEDQPAWPEGKRLARELAPDRAAGASDENAVAAERIRDRVEIDPRWRTAEEILDLDLSDRVHRDPPGDYLRDARHGQAPCAFRFGLADETPQRAAVGCGQGKKHDPYAISLDDAFKIRPATKHGKPEESLT